MKMGPIICPETSVNNYQTKVCNITEDYTAVDARRHVTLLIVWYINIDISKKNLRLQ
jgi:hypothetical protein